jgi:hypothetical protein
MFGRTLFPDAPHPGAGLVPDLIGLGSGQVSEAGELPAPARSLRFSWGDNAQIRVFSFGCGEPREGIQGFPVTPK